MPDRGLIKADTLFHVDILAMLVLASLCLLVPTNGVGSTGLGLAFVWVAVRDSSLRTRWWQAVRLPLLVATLYLLYLGLVAFRPMHGLKDSWAVLRGLLFSLLGVYLSQLPVARLRASGFWVVLAMTLLAVGVLLYNVDLHGLHDTLTREDLDTTVHRNRLAVGLALTFLLAIVFLLTSQDWRVRLPLLLCALFLCFESYINSCRGAMLGMLAGAWLLGLWWNWRLTAVLTLVGGLILLGLQEQGKLAAIVTHNGTIDDGRDNLWAYVFERIQLRPWTGYGLHALPFDPVFNAKHADLMLGHPHSIYVELVYASGIIGVLFWLGWYGVLGRRLFGAFGAQARDSQYLGLVLFIYMLVHGAVDFSFYSLAPACFLVIGFSALMIAAPARAAP